MCTEHPQYVANRKHHVHPHVHDADTSPRFINRQTHEKSMTSKCTIERFAMKDLEGRRRPTHCIAAMYWIGYMEYLLQYLE